MSVNKNLNNKELEKVVGGEGNRSTLHIFNKGNWISEDSILIHSYEIVYYIKDVIDDKYHLIKYLYHKDYYVPGPQYTKNDIGTKPCKVYEYKFKKIEKPSWIEDDPS